MLYDLFTQSAADFLDGWFESDSVKAVFGFDSIVGAFASPKTPGTAYVQLHHCFGEVNGKKGVWGHALGGMGAITQAMAKACGEKGVEIDDRRRRHRNHCRRRPRPGRRPGRRPGLASQSRRFQPQSQAALRQPGTRGIIARGFSCPHETLEMRVGHLPHECGAFRVALLHVSAWSRDGRSPRFGHHHRADPRPTWTVPTTTPGNSVGAASPLSRSSSPRRSIPRSLRRVLMWRACSASMWRLNFPMVLRGTITATR